MDIHFPVQNQSTKELTGLLLEINKTKKAYQMSEVEATGSQPDSMQGSA